MIIKIDNQFGFIKGKSTENVLLNVTELIHTSLNLKINTTVLFLDFKKVFDLVDHETLFLKNESK